MSQLVQHAINRSNGLEMSQFGIQWIKLGHLGLEMSQLVQTYYK